MFGRYWQKNKGPVKVVPVTFTCTEFVEVPENATDLDAEKEFRSLYAEHFAGLPLNVKVGDRLCGTPIEELRKGN